MTSGPRTNVFTSERISRAHAIRRSQGRWWATIALTLVGVAVWSWLILSEWTQQETFQTLAVASLSGETEIVMLGSSHVDIMTNPKLIDHTLMNLSGDACNYGCMDAVLRGNIDRVPQLRTVVIELDIIPLIYDTIELYKGDNRRLFDLRPSLGDLDEAWSRKARLYWQRALQYSDLLAPFISRNKLAPRAVVSKSRHGRHGGKDQFTAGHRIRTEVMTEARDGDDRIAVHSAEGSLDQVDRSIEALLRIIEYAQGRGLQVILLRYPHHHTYWENRPPSWDDAYDRALMAVRERFPEVSVWDLEKVGSFRDDEFFDGDHLNHRGADKLSEMLNAKFNESLGAP